MRAKSLILLVVALGCGMIAAVAVSKAVMDDGPTEKVEATVEIFVAVKDLPHAERISAENVKLDKWPKSRVPEGALYNLEQVEGKFTKQNIFANEPILERKLSESRESFSTGVPPGYRIFDIVGNAGYIKPGDHVDILGTFKLGGRNSAPESRTVMRNVKVHGINGITTRDTDQDSPARGKGTVFQLLVKESQLEALTLANSLGELQLNLRPFGEDGRTDDTDNGESFLTWVNDSESVPEKVEEPQPAEPVNQLLTRSMEQLFSRQPEPEIEPKHKMLIITPNGVKTYEWTNDRELPREAVEKPANADQGDRVGAATALKDSSENVYSGYGGYSPTYPIGTNTSVPASGSGGPTLDPDNERR